MNQCVNYSRVLHVWKADPLVPGADPEDLSSQVSFLFSAVSSSNDPGTVRKSIPDSLGIGSVLCPRGAYLTDLQPFPKMHQWLPKPSLRRSPPARWGCPLKGVLAHFCSVACFFQINSSPVEPPESDSRKVSAHLEFSSRLYTGTWVLFNAFMKIVLFKYFIGEQQQKEWGFYVQEKHWAIALKLIELISGQRLKNKAQITSRDTHSNLPWHVKAGP